VLTSTDAGQAQPLVLVANGLSNPIVADFKLGTAVTYIVAKQCRAVRGVIESQHYDVSFFKGDMPLNSKLQLIVLLGTVCILIATARVHEVCPRSRLPMG
jgi:hypothetical protein